ncbi:MAG: hypothetical protein R3E44_14020 [Paracoccaceae bacterium]
MRVQAKPDSDTVGRRRVFYIPGYDPFHPRRYRELYRKEGAAQAAISGYELALSPGQGEAGNGWDVAARFDRAEVGARVDVLVWSDIVRASMAQGVIATYRQLARTVWVYVASGAIFRLARLRKGPAIAAFYPIGLLVLQMALALGLVAALFGLMTLVADGWLLRLCYAAAALLAGWELLKWFKRKDNLLFAHYLMHDYAYTAQSGGANPPELELRLAAFGNRIADALAEDWDEVLVVGHSSGAHLAVSVLADLIRAGRVPQCAPALGFLSLGHVVPMVSFLPGAGRLRGDLAYLSTREEVTWVDVTAPGDGCTYALCDPVLVSGLSPEGKRWPLIVSAAFTQTLSPARWKALRWRFFRLHFQYLCAFDRPGDYDYFRITAGPKTLAARYRNRLPSQSRIETARNPYRDIA